MSSNTFMEDFFKNNIELFNIKNEIIDNLVADQNFYAIDSIKEFLNIFNSILYKSIFSNNITKMEKYLITPVNQIYRLDKVTIKLFKNICIYTKMYAYILYKFNQLIRLINKETTFINDPRFIDLNLSIMAYPIYDKELGYVFAIVGIYDALGMTHHYNNSKPKNILSLYKNTELIRDSLAITLLRKYKQYSINNLVIDFYDNKDIINEINNFIFIDKNDKIHNKVFTVNDKLSFDDLSKNISLSLLDDLVDSPGLIVHSLCISDPIKIPNILDKLGNIVPPKRKRRHKKKQNL